MREPTKERSIVDVIQDRMDDPNYIPTGPTYGESDLGMRPTLSLEQLQMVARINWDRAILTERERCAKIAESVGPEWGHCGAQIAATIRGNGLCLNCEGRGRVEKWPGITPTVWRQCIHCKGTGKTDVLQTPPAHWPLYTSL